MSELGKWSLNEASLKLVEFYKSIYEAKNDLLNNTNREDVESRLKYINNCVAEIDSELNNSTIDLRIMIARNYGNKTDLNSNAIYMIDFLYDLFLIKSKEYISKLPSSLKNDYSLILDKIDKKIDSNFKKVDAQFGNIETKIKELERQISKNQPNNFEKDLFSEWEELGKKLQNSYSKEVNLEKTK
jgi:hypothetical protein